MKEVVWKWNARQSEALQASEPFIDFEGGVGAGKTTPLLAKTEILCVEYPGIHCFLGRWTDDALQAQLKPAWRDFAAKCGLELNWHPDEEYDEVMHTARGESGNSRVYLRGLKTSELVSKYGKLRGLNLSFIGIDQGEELPKDFFDELVGRLRQAGNYPKQLWLVCNPVNQSHWIADAKTGFPIDNSHSGFRYIHTNVYDNRHNVGDEFVRLMEMRYPPGSSARRTLLEGHRGLATSGQAVFEGSFSRHAHVNNSLVMNPDVPLLEGWDYGHKHPAVVWAQIYGGRISVLGGVMGQDMPIDAFASYVVEQRSAWFPNALDIQTTGDPAGMSQSSQGLPTTLRDIMAEHGIVISAVGTANRPEVRDQAIQALSRYMRRKALDQGEAFQINAKRCALVKAAEVQRLPILCDALEAGYVWEAADRARQGQLANIRRPEKNGPAGFYSHLMDALLYILIAFGPANVTEKDARKLEMAEVRAAQREERDKAAWDKRGQYGRRGGY